MKFQVDISAFLNLLKFPLGLFAPGVPDVEFFWNFYVVDLIAYLNSDGSQLQVGRHLFERLENDLGWGGVLGH